MPLAEGSGSGLKRFMFWSVILKPVRSCILSRTPSLSRQECGDIIFKASAEDGGSIGILIYAMFYE